MSDIKTRDAIRDSADRFASETAEHRMTVLHDDGLYRHLRFAKPGTWMYWFELVTWPDTLAVRGDVGRGYTFHREEDMFAFFRAGKGINPGYWAEKLSGGRASAKEYSEHSLRDHVAGYLNDAEPEYPGVTAAWNTFVEDDNVYGYDLQLEDSARRALEHFRYRAPEADFAPVSVAPFRFKNTWDWDLRGYSWEFLWVCHAIRWGIQQYDAVIAPYGERVSIWLANGADPANLRPETAVAS